MKLLLFHGTNEYKLHIRFFSWMHELAFTRKEFASPFLTLLLTFTCVTILYLKSIRPDFLCLWTFGGFPYLPEVSVIKCCFVTRVWMVANLKYFSSTVWTSQLVDLLLPFFLYKEKTHQQLGADCWVLTVFNSSCFNFYVTGNNSWPKAKKQS